VGHDPADPTTALGVHRPPPSYLASLDADALKGSRIGLLMDFLGPHAIHQPVNAVVAEVVAKMKDAGASVVEMRIPNLAELTRDLTLTPFEFKVGFNRYLA